MFLSHAEFIAFRIRFVCSVSCSQTDTNYVIFLAFGSMAFVQALRDLQAGVLTFELALESLRMSWIMGTPLVHFLVQKASDGAKEFNFKGTSRDDDEIDQRPSFHMKIPLTQR